ncbi:MAG: hypothetical protein CMH27_02250 [Micavibrio sp.]|nr:hypothetical protein [Micavibrio sp.]|tara:strand:+ start:10323 stop:10919 length:597 start_codon:yes stop_codon:yes gene_type:complete
MRNLIDIIQDKNAQGIPVYVMPVGLPASGKSSFYKELASRIDIQLLGFDAITEEFQKANNLSYGEAYEQMPLEEKTKRFETRRDSLIADSHNIYPDLTNLSGATRGDVLRDLPQYFHIGIFFPINEDESKIRCQQRQAQTGKHVPEDVIEMMASNMNKPRPIEFDMLFQYNEGQLTLMSNHDHNTQTPAATGIEAPAL